MIPIARPILDREEIEGVVAVLESGNLAQGKVVDRFERMFAEMIGVKHAIAVSSGTAALHAALLAHGIGQGDEVITTPFTFAATANAVLYTGARPVFVDILEDTFNINPDLIREKITARTKAILPVHLYGHPADMLAIAEVADEAGLPIIEDAAQAHGAAIGGRKVGTFGTGCFSFYATKNITVGEGGIVTTNEDKIAERLNLLRNHGQRGRYHHEVLGYNYRMTDLHAAIGVAQLSRLEEFTLKRIANAEYFNARLRNVVTPRSRPDCRHVYNQYTIRIPRARDDAVRILKNAGIATAVHYPIPIHKQPLYLNLGFRDTLPVAEKASSEVLSLPVHPALSQQDLETIVAAVSNLHCK